jgi:transcriptional regulator with XRE-family HTH domain
MPLQNAAQYLRSLRSKSGLTQRELASILGLISGVTVSRHESASTMPVLLVAMGYQVIFRAPIEQLFPGTYEAVRQNIEDRLSEFEAELQQSSIKGRRAAMIAQKLEWLWERRNLDAA